MDIVLRFTVFGIGLAFTSMTYYLLIRKKVTERTTLLWSLFAVIAFIFSLFPTVLNRLAAAVGVNYPPALLFLVTTLILMLLVMYQSMQISITDQRVREIGRILALVQNQIVKIQNTRTADIETSTQEEPADHETEPSQ